MPADTPFYSSAFTRGIFGRGESGPQQKNGGNITLRVILPTLRPDEVLAVAGSGRELEGWQRIVPLDDSRFPGGNSGSTRGRDSNTSSLSPTAGP